MPKIHLITEICAPITRCFDLARSIDLHKISTQKTNEQAIVGKTSGLIGLGEFVTWQATHFGIKQKLTSKITAFERPIYFKDEQLQGAFQSFVHEHLFEQVGNKVIMQDIFDFKAPFGIVGKVFNYLVLTRYMRKLLMDRNQVIREFAETDLWKKVLVEQDYEQG